MARLDPLQQVFQGQAGTGAAGIFPQRDTTPKNIIGQKVKVEKPKVPGIPSKIMEIVPWEYDQEILGQEYDALVTQLTDKIANGININQDPESLKLMREYMFNAGVADEHKKQFYDTIRKAKEKGIMENLDPRFWDDIYDWAQGSTYKDRPPIIDLQDYMLEEPEEPLDLATWFNTAYKGTDFTQEYGYYDENLGQKVTGARLDQKKIRESINSVLELPIAQKLADDNTGGDLDKLAQQIERMIVDRQLIKTSNIPYSPSGGSKAQKNNQYLNRYNEIQTILNRYNFRDPAKVDLAEKITERMIGGTGPNDIKITSAEYRLGYRDSQTGAYRDALLINGDIPIYLDDPRSFEIINRALSTTGAEGENITYEDIDQWIEENQSIIPKQYVENPRDRSGDVPPAARYNGAISILQGKGDAQYVSPIYVEAFGELTRELTGLANEDGRIIAKVEPIKRSIGTIIYSGDAGNIRVTYEDDTTETYKPDDREALGEWLNTLTYSDTGEPWVPQTPVKTGIVKGGATINIESPSINQNTPNKPNNDDPLGLGL